MGEKVFSQTRGNMQHHMDVLQSRLAKMQNHEIRAEKAEKAQRDMAAEIKRLREEVRALRIDNARLRDERFREQDH